MIKLKEKFYPKYTILCRTLWDLAPNPRRFHGRKSKSSSSISNFDLYSRTLDLHFSVVNNPLAR